MGKVNKKDTRLRKKEYDKRRRESMKKDPEKLEEMRLKERIKYLKKKEKGQAKQVAKMNTREHRQKKKQWRENSKTYRKKLLVGKKAKDFLENNSPPPPSTPPSSGVAEPGYNPEGLLGKPSTSSSRKEVGRKRIRRDRSKMYKKIQKLESELKCFKAKAEKYRKRFYRLKRKEKPNNNDLSVTTPRTRVARLIGKEKVSTAVRKKLLFGEVLSDQLRESYVTLGKSHSQKQMYYRMLRGQVIKKYRLLSASSKTYILKYKGLKANVNKPLFTSNKIPRGKCITNQVKEDIISFLENDENTRMCPGKKECITLKKVKKQKRFLNNSLQTLHKKFLLTVPYKISYASFCRVKPFWILQANANERNTCKCVIHANFEMMVMKLHEYHVFKYANPNDLLEDLCCNVYNEDCLFRKCLVCKTKCIKYNLLDGNREIKRKKWTYKTATFKINDKEKSTRKPIKEESTVVLKDLLTELQESLGKFMNHVGNITHQHKSMYKLKATLSSDSAVLHIDFSENYACKFSEEIQSVHFGGARQQITLHTGVMYVKNSSGELTTNSFCTLSESNRHDPAAIWAHLKPIFKWASTKCLNELKVLHILSDGPVTQYKNKKNFHLISHHINDFLPSVLYFTWNYTESGHGKGAPDGIGGTLKRTADKSVAEGKDVACFSDLMTILKERCPGVRLFTVLKQDIEEVDILISECSIPTFSGTLKVHQVVYSVDNLALEFRKLSCFDCSTHQCSHFTMGHGHHRQDGNCTKQTNSEGQPIEMLLENGASTRTTVDELNLAVGDWVLVQYDEKMYPGEVMQLCGDGVVANTMEPTKAGQYKWPTKQDILLYQHRDIIKKKSVPIPCDSRMSQFRFLNWN